jgi:hypothetical protein
MHEYIQKITRPMFFTGLSFGRVEVSCSSTKQIVSLWCAATQATAHCPWLHGRVKVLEHIGYGMLKHNGPDVLEHNGHDVLEHFGYHMLEHF